MSARAIDLKKHILALRCLLSDLKKASTLLDKLAILNILPIVQEYLQHPSPIRTFLNGLTPECDYAIKSIIAIGQAPVVFNMIHTQEDRFELLRELLEHLLNLESFYQDLGGIIGYHIAVIDLIINHEQPPKDDLEHIHYIHPDGLYLTQDQPEVRQAVRWGIENMTQLAEIYPVGGAGDRLNLKDKTTGVPLPAAVLPFQGRSLLEGLIRDLQAREYLSFKLTGKQALTPVAIMTSEEKNNHQHVLNICQSCQWFGRPSSSFYFFTQPLVPVITIEGNWSLISPLTLTLKPSGHGVIWKLAEEKGVFAWFKSHQRQHCLIRQINNPLAGTDLSLLALGGVGYHKHKAFGFVSCERLLNSAEGTNVLIETDGKDGYDYCLTNIEYTDFTQRRMDEVPIQPGSSFSSYPTNTNILFADISTIRNIIKNHSIPGQLINMKTKVSYINSEGQQSYVYGGRLESTMQNVADYLVDHFPNRLSPEECKELLRTFIIYNDREKTISTTKKSYHPGESPISTPEQAFYDLLTNHYALLKKCQFELPEWEDLDSFIKKGPECLFIFHPALGPLFSVIAQKIRKGLLAKGAEFQLEIAEADIENLHVEGSLLIEAAAPLGIYDAYRGLHYSNESRCTLRHVKIRNKGIDREATHSYWSNTVHRLEEVKIILNEGAEFFAEDVAIEGKHEFVVPAYHRLTLSQSSSGGWKKTLQSIQQPSWSWHYTFDEQDAIRLTMRTNH